MHSNRQHSETVFGAQVKRLRDEMGIPPAVLTEALRAYDGIELDSRALVLLEQGARVIRLDEAVAFAKALDMTVDEMLQPAYSLDDRISQARQALTHAQLHVAEATAELETAAARLERLEALATLGNDDKPDTTRGPG